MYAEHTELTHLMVREGIREAPTTNDEVKYESLGDWEQANGQRFLDYAEGS